MLVFFAIFFTALTGLHRLPLGAHLGLLRALAVGGLVGAPLLGGVDLGQEPVTFVLAQQAAPGRVAHQLLGVLHMELRQPGAGADHVAEGIRHRAAQHVGDAWKRLEQGRDLGTAEFGHHDSSFAFRGRGAPQRGAGTR